MDKVEKIALFYLFILYIILDVLTIATFTIGPLILGLVFSPYWFFGYILTVAIAPLIILMVGVTPSLYQTLMED